MIQAQTVLTFRRRGRGIIVRRGPKLRLRRRVVLQLLQPLRLLLLLLLLPPRRSRSKLRDFDRWWHWHWQWLEALSLGAARSVIGGGRLLHLVGDARPRPFHPLPDLLALAMRCEGRRRSTLPCARHVRRERWLEVNEIIVRGRLLLLLLLPMRWSVDHLDLGLWRAAGVGRVRDVRRAATAVGLVIHDLDT